MISPYGYKKQWSCLLDGKSTVQISCCLYTTLLYSHYHSRNGMCQTELSLFRAAKILDKVLDKVLHNMLYWL
jgi:hypothetical protein